jgi:chemotaxis protein MotB
MPMPQKPKIEKDTAERWLLTYADLMNLLLIFFIVLYAMSQVDAAKFNQLAQSLNMSLGNSSLAPYIDNAAVGGTTLIPLPATAPSSVIPANMDEQVIDNLKKQVSAVVKEKGLEGKIDVTVQERGVVISIDAQMLFKSGNAELEADSKPTIGEIGDILLKVPGKQIKIEGHTDNDAMNSTQFPSNWELSSARATNVLRLLVDKTHIDPTKISSVGYGEFRPLVPNTTEENKAKNRRVDIVILRDVLNESEAGVSQLIAAPTVGTANATPKNNPVEQNPKNNSQAPKTNTTTVVKNTQTAVKAQSPAVAKPAETVKATTPPPTVPAETQAAAPPPTVPNNADTTTQDQPADNTGGAAPPTDQPTDPAATDSAQ